MKMNTKRWALGFAVSGVLFLTACGRTDAPATTAAPVETTAPETEPQAYVHTWEEFENLSAEEQIAFQNSFESPEAFEAWLQSVKMGREEMPWDQGGKRPEEYTWEEFDALTARQQIAFQNSFAEHDGFERWLEAIENVKASLPWEQGGKQPGEYTWEEFEALSMELQIAFQDSFGTIEAFDAWMQRVNPQEDAFAWESGGKPLEDYTWEEFEAMTPEEQMAFQNAFESWEAFDQWMLSAQFSGEDLPWNNGGKEPAAYTWEEFEALSPEQQIRFQNSFDSVEAFEQWLYENMP